MKEFEVAPEVFYEVKNLKKEIQQLKNENSKLHNEINRHNEINICLINK